MTQSISQIGRTVSMMNSQRFVNIRGYVRKVTVSHKTKDGQWVVVDGKNREIVHEDDFYHAYNAGLEYRGSVEFKRRYPTHPVEIENLPSL